MAITGPTTGFKAKDLNTGNSQDLGQRFVSKDYLLDVYPNIVPGRTSPGLWSWGGFNFGESGRNVAVYAMSSPVQVGLLTNWKQIGYQKNIAHAIKSDGSLWMLGGNNSLGSLGDGTTVNKSSPIQIGTLTNWKQVSSYNTVCGAIKTDGTLWKWGRGTSGALGDGQTAANRSSPVQIGTLTNWKLLSAALYSNWALKTDGTLWAWGANSGGQLGDGTTVPKSSPVQIGTLTNWKIISAKSVSSMAIKTDGSLWGWGFNTSGSIGDGTTANRSSPVQIGGLTNWKYVDTALNNWTLAVKTDGTLWAWGSNANGELGDGTTVSKSSPVQIGSLTNWKLVSAGSYHSAAIKTDGTLWTWGSNSSIDVGYGQLGIGLGTTTDKRSSPVQVGTLTNWKLVIAGLYGTMAIRDGYL